MDQNPEGAIASPHNPAINRPRRTRGRIAGDAALARLAQAAAALSSAETRGEPTRSSADDVKADANEPKTRTPAGTDLILAPPPTRDAEAPVPRHHGAARNLPLFAAALCLTLGIGGALGSRMAGTAEGNAAASEETARIEKALPWKRDVAEAGARDSGRLRDDLRALRSDLAALRANGDQMRQAETQKQGADMRALRGLLESQKSELASVKADLAARFDRADHEAVQRADKLSERVDRLEKRLADPTPTASIAKPVAPSKADTPIHGIVLREVSHGVALLESRRGLMEVAVGDSVPGAGRVETIEKRGGKWRVVTTTGIIDDRVE